MLVLYKKKKKSRRRRKKKIAGMPMKNHHVKAAHLIISKINVSRDWINHERNRRKLLSYVQRDLFLKRSEY